jgi:hypothetical protein
MAILGRRRQEMAMRLSSPATGRLSRSPDPLRERIQAGLCSLVLLRSDVASVVAE